MSIDHYIPTKLIFGTGALDKLATINLPGKKALLVTSSGNSVKRLGYLERVQNLLKKNNVEWVLFDKILPNPVKEHVMEGAELAKENECDFVIGLGGGSSMDSAKSIAVMATNPGDYWDYITGGSGKAEALVSKPLPIVVISTTAGTGTEVDPRCVITKEETMEKIGFGSLDTNTFPTIAIVDPELLISVPAALTAYQGFDALFHAIEGYISVKANPFSDLYALKSIELIGKYLPKAVKDGYDLEARSNTALANILSGMVETTSSCTSEHALEHALSAYHPQLPHGAGLIMISEAYNRYFAEKAPERYIEMAKALGRTDATNPMDFVDELLNLQEKCNVRDLRMSDYDIVEEDFVKYAENALQTTARLFSFDPAPIGLEEVVEMYRKSYK